MKKLSLGLLLALWLASGSGCARPQARTVPMPPPLSVPPAPPRLIVPDAEPIPATPLPEASVVEPAATDGRSARLPPPRTESPRPEAPREEPPPAEAEASAEPPGPGPQLQVVTPRTGDPGEATGRIREALHRASQNLGLVDPGALKPDARTQYDTARRFVEHAEEALRVRNLVFATYLASKADTLARELVGRR